MVSKQSQEEIYVCRAFVFSFFCRFSDCRNSTEDDGGCRWKAVIGPSAVTSIENELKTDCQMTIQKLPGVANLNYVTMTTHSNHQIKQVDGVIHYSFLCTVIIIE